MDQEKTNRKIYHQNIVICVSSVKSSIFFNEWKMSVHKVYKMPQFKFDWKYALHTNWTLHFF